MAGKIFLLQADETLIPMTEQTYATENLLQTLLEKYPDLLAGDQMNEDAPRRWLLVSREYGVPDQEDGAGRWSLDHLFLDQDGIPTLVEVKRSTDTRIRREVVGQMLDYAANAVAFWPLAELRARLEATCEAQGLDAAQAVAELVGYADEDAAVETFWSQVKTNLQAGRIRLVFVADEIPAELRRIVEFLNGQMDPAEVLAVEVKQYVGEGQKTLVPHVMGQTAEAQQKKSPSWNQRQPWDEASFFPALEREHGADAAHVARVLHKWAKEKGLRLWWGRGKHDGSFYPMLDNKGAKYHLISVWTSGRVTIHFEQMQNQPPFDVASQRQALLDRLNAITTVHLPEDVLARRPSISLVDLKGEQELRRFLETLDWVVDEIRLNDSAASFSGE